MKYSANVNRITCKVSCMWQNIAFHRNIKKKKKATFIIRKKNQKQTI